MATAAALATAVALAVAPPALADTSPSGGTPATVSADPLPTVQVDGVVWSQVVVGNTVYVAGDFDSARPAGAAAGTQQVRRTNLLAYDIRTGVLDPSFAPTTNGQVLAITRSPDGSRIYIGGQFTEVNGQARWRIAAFDTATKQLLGFAPNAGTTVRSLAATDAALYVGGEFKTLNGASRPYAGAVSANGGGILPWRPVPDGPVTALTLNPSGSLVVVGGRFARLGSTAAAGIGAVSPSSGAAQRWGTSGFLRTANAGTAVTSLTTDGASVYVTTYNWNGGGNLEGSFKANGTTGALEWVEDCQGDHYSAFPAGGTLYIASHTHNCSNIGDGFMETTPTTRYHSTAMTTAATARNSYNAIYGKDSFDSLPSPSLLHWYPQWTPGTFTGQNQATWHVTGNGDYVVYGGEFTSVNGRAQQGLVRFARTALAPNRTGPSNDASLTPSAVSVAPGIVDLGWQAAQDADNRNLTYTVYRSTDGGASRGIYASTVASKPWDRPTITYRDSGLAAGSTQRYRIVAADPNGNATSSSEVAVVVAGKTSAYADAVLQSDPTNWFRMDDGSGNGLRDSRGGADATGAAGLARGVGGATADGNTATRFPGNVAGTAATKVSQPGPQQFSVEAWLRTTSTSGGRIVGYGESRSGLSTGGRTDRHLYVDSSGKLRFGVDVGLQQSLSGKTLLTVASPGRVNDGAWHHAVGTLDSSGLKLYLDGRLVASRTDATRARAFTGVWRIGGDRLTSWPARPASDFFAGSIDEVAVYGRALTAREIAGHHQASRGTVQPDSALRPITPLRLADTRKAGGAIPAGGVLQVQVAGRGGIPADAAAAALNVTVTGPTGSGWVVAYPCGTTPPKASNLNFTAGQTVPNAVLAGIGTGGQVCFKASTGTHLIVDANGWFPKGSGYTPTKPLRLADTRTSGGAIPAGGVLQVKVAGIGGVPGSAVAASMNVTVTQPKDSGFVTAYPCGSSVPLSSNLNFTAGQTVPNAVLSGIGSGGRICFRASAATHLVVDVNGSFTPQAAFTPVRPVRVMDTRSTGRAVATNGILKVTVVGAEVPTTAAAVSMNVTVTQPTGSGYVTAYPCGTNPPLASSLNFSRGQTVPNAVLSGVGQGGQVCFKASAGTHLVVDVNGWFPG